MHGRRQALCLMLLAVLVLPGCASPSRFTYIPDGESYSADTLTDALAQSDPGATARVKTSEAVEVRQEALANLRTKGEDAGDLADMLTSEFPTNTAAIPYLVEHGEFDGQPAWIVFEAWGETGGTLSGRRVWVFAYDDLSVLAAHSTP